MSDTMTYFMILVICAALLVFENKGLQDKLFKMFKDILEELDTLSR